MLTVSCRHRAADLRSRKGSEPWKICFLSSTPAVWSRWAVMPPSPAPGRKVRSAPGAPSSTLLGRNSSARSFSNSPAGRASRSRQILLPAGTSPSAVHSINRRGRREKFRVRRSDGVLLWAAGLDLYRPCGNKYLTIQLNPKNISPQKM
jgi:hypothetical protein